MYRTRIQRGGVSGFRDSFCSSSVHVDSDLYSSATTILTALVHWLVPGTVIVFDEYFNFPAWELHEYKAFREFVTAHQVAYDYLGFTRREGAVAVKIRAKG